jgi:hypothetical protein
MNGSKHSPEQIVRKLREADRMLGEGREIADVAKQREISDARFHGWRPQYGAMKANDAKELPQLRNENQRLKQYCT